MSGTGIIRSTVPFIVGLLFVACGSAKKEHSVPVSVPVVVELDVTGTYQMGGGSSGDGSSGMMLVRKDHGTTYEVALLINRGAPSYNSGEVRATLSLQEGKMQYPAVLEDDMSCIIDFYFDKDGVEVRQDMDMEKPDCEFGYGVTAMGYLTKISSEPPVIPSGACCCI